MRSNRSFPTMCSTRLTHVYTHAYRLMCIAHAGNCSSRGWMENTLSEASSTAERRSLCFIPASQHHADGERREAADGSWRGPGIGRRVQRRDGGPVGAATPDSAACRRPASWIHNKGSGRRLGRTRTSTTTTTACSMTSQTSGPSPPERPDIFLKKRPTRRGSKGS